ncbi:LysR family transcriptional regulator [Pseudovibrio exalbescens]|uniref:LysR family transcriptional regulator n=1 Tax=Pseudovibrio exalbescens TaxID=197461 RepID=UPI0023655687|nr:LysR family transcriptional regulator [Pseudovibrio exalbescens]MDD7912130.1 LysR family transcriptional regulator [Pseudovibrio exalbescens]
MDTIDAMRAFVAVAKEGSFTAAARRLGKSTKLISNHVAWLEGQHDVQLFNRTTRSVMLTDAGRDYLLRCEPILDQVDELSDLAQKNRRELRGPIRMTAPTSFGSQRLPAALAAFMHLHSSVEVELILNDSHVALVEEGYDLAVRIGTPTDSTLMMKRLCPMPLITCAAPEYLARSGVPAEPADLAAHSCLLGKYFNVLSDWTYQKSGQVQSVRVSGRLMSNSPSAGAALAAQGIGIARLPLYVVQPYLKDGRLVHLLPDYEAKEYGVMALYPANRHLTARVRALIDHLADYFGPGGAGRITLDELATAE